MMKSVFLPGWAVKARCHKEICAETLGDTANSPVAIAPTWGDTNLFVCAVFGEFDDWSRAVATICHACDPDTLTFAADSFMAERPIGEASDQLVDDLESRKTSLAEIAAGGGVERGEVIHAVNAVFAERDDARIKMCCMPYKPKATRVWWDNAAVQLADEALGRVPDMLRFYMRGEFPKMVDDAGVQSRMREQGVSADRGRFLAMQACAQQLYSAGCWIVPLHPELKPADYTGRRKRRPDPGRRRGK